MAKALKVFIVLLLVLGAAALGLEVMVFLKRQELKGRTQKLEQAVVDVGRNLTTAREPFIQGLPQSPDAEMLKVFRNDLEPSKTMDAPLNLVRSLAENRLVELNNTYTDLKQTRDDLATTRQELADTRRQLETARTEIARLEGVVREKDAEIAARRREIEELNGKVAGMEQELQAAKDTIAKAEEERQELKDRIVSLEQTLRAIDKSLDPSGAAQDVPRGLSGQVLVVYPEWNFVILNLGLGSKLAPNVEMLVHRGDDLVGKIRVTSVKEKIAIADIERDFEKMPIREGDHVLF